MLYKIHFITIIDNKMYIKLLIIFNKYIYTYRLYIDNKMNSNIRITSLHISILCMMMKFDLLRTNL